MASTKNLCMKIPNGPTVLSGYCHNGGELKNEGKGKIP